ncbi:AraC family transcriptional regulator [uncultured Desulfobacter sp.]|uniref:helix-turn-helix domain-containing protein n=1 Tax=uncultured Desulfobacter sp. TaxID=240139 RepID=UPI002AA95441|nr:AraC family transcriptional regulator [uncultured Desulfobacter sp.]
MFEQSYLSFLSEFGFYSVGNAQGHRRCGLSYKLDPALGTGGLWLYLIDDLYGISVYDFVLDCDICLKLAHPPFFLIRLNDTCCRKQPHQGRTMPSETLFSYAGHEDVFQGEIKKGMAVRSISVCVMPDFYNTLLPQRYPQSSMDPNLFSPKINNNDCIPEITGVLHQLGNFRPSEKIARMFYDSKVTELLSIMIQREINRESQPHASRIPDGDMAHLQRVMAYLNKNFTQTVYLDELARDACMSRTKLTHLFKKTYGTTISDHIKTLRINLAKEMLADTSMKIEAIANIAGYRFHGNFSGAFKHATGLTPNQFRKTLL